MKFQLLILGASLAVLPTVFFIPSKIILNELNKQVPPEPAIIEHAVITNIYDGDTVSIQFTKEYPIRLLNCWAPEITGKEKTEGLKSREYLKSILKPQTNK